MQTVKISRKEIERGVMQPENLDAAINAVREDGVVLLPGVINIEHIERLGEKMLEDIQTVEKTQGIVNNWQGVRPPLFHPYLFKDIVFNEMAVAVSHRLMGDGIVIDACGANTAFWGNTQQGVHADAHQLWSTLDFVPPPHNIVINVVLVDVDESNGATKFWPGTHTDTRITAGNRRPTEEMIAEWEAKRPAERMCTKKGDLVVRDMRVWHCGMPNHTDIPRPMLAIIYQSGWWQRSGFEAEKGSEDFFEHPILQNSAVFVDAPIDYLHQGHSRPLRKR